MTASCNSSDIFMAIDCGNSRVKATLLQGSEVIKRALFRSADTEGLLTLIEQLNVRAAAMVSVGRMDVRMVETLRNVVDDRFLLLTHNTPVPLNIAYATPATLGLDRVAAAAGARALYPGRECVVVDAGTAVTIDLLTADGSFVGGSISPGIALSISALHNNTAALPDIRLDDVADALPKRWADNTHDAILSGVIGMISDRIICSDAPGRLTLITGGDAPLLYKNLSLSPKADDARLALVPDLLACGLRYIFDHYENHI